MMSASLLILTLAIGADHAEQPVLRQSGLAGLISTTMATSRRPRAGTHVRENRSSRRAVIDRRRQRRLSGGGADASQLIGLIQTTIAPDSWQAPAGAGGFGNPVGGGAAAPRMQLIDLIQEIEPESWDINGGPGLIGVFAP
jgi:hypothetical protein